MSFFNKNKQKSNTNKSTSKIKNKNCIYEIERDRIDEYYIYTAKYSCPAHFHKQLEIIYCNLGKQQITVNNITYVLKRNDIIIVSPYAVHSYDESNAKCTTVCIPTVFFSYYNKYFSNLNDQTRIIRAEKNTKQVIKAVEEAKKSKGKNYYCELAAVLKILGELIAIGNFTVVSDSAQNDLVSIITDYIDNNYKEKIDLTSLSEHCHYSKQYLSQFFNEHFNCGFSDFVNIVRLNAFVELQTTRGGNFSDNALAVGFQTTRTFYNVFKERYNMTPTEYFSNKQ